MTGLHLSHYRIDSELGRGGMGVVYKAFDTQLDRAVALKVLPASALASADDRARFFREAKAAASISHPNVCHVYQVDEAQPLTEDGQPVEGQTEKRLFIAMEYIAGETLHDYVKKGPLRLQEAVSIAGQIAEALKEAHAKEIVHRDIKSANVMLTETGVAKVLDFGLAKTNQSTMLTRMGSTLGTVAYMSPEQARGQEVDGRSDLYSLGTVLYEMVAGKLPFAGDYEQAVVYSILNEAPEPLTAIRTGVPMQLEWIINKLLSKEAEYRYQSAAGLLADLKSLDLSGSGQTARSMPAISEAITPAAGQLGNAPKWVWLAIAGAAVAAFGLGGLFSGGGSDSGAAVYLTISLPGAMRPISASWTPDGQEIYYVARDSLSATSRVRSHSLADGLVRDIPGTENATYVHISPVGRWLVLYNSASGRYERMRVEGGQPSEIPGMEDAIGEGAQMNALGELFFTDTDHDVMALSAGGQLRTVASNPQQGRFYGIVAVPEGDGVFWTNATGNRTHGGSWGTTGPDGGPEYVLPQYAIRALGSNGYALVSPAGGFSETVAIAPIDVDSGRLEAVPVPFDRMGNLALSQNGHLLYETRYGGLAGAHLLSLVRGDQRRSGGRLDRNTQDIAVAKHRQAIIAEAQFPDSDGYDLVLFDLGSRVPTRLTRSGDNRNPWWSQDDEYVYFDRRVGDAPEFIARRRVDLSGDIEEVLVDSLRLFDPVVSADGSTLVFTAGSASNRSLYGLRIETDEKFSIRDADGTQDQASFSPNGRYLVYHYGHNSDSIIVTPLDGEGDTQITGNGSNPVWSLDGAFIYFERERRYIYRVPVTTEPLFAPTGAEELVFTSPDHVHFDVLEDGTLVVATPEGVEVGEDSAIELRVVLNFNGEMERLAPRDR